METTKATNTKEFLKHLHNTMMMLKQKMISIEEANQQANLVKQANNLLRYELDKAKAIAKYENININNIES